MSVDDAQKIAMINCHTHLFTLDHVPPNFPFRYADKLTGAPGVLRGAGRLLGKLHREGGEKVERLARMAATGKFESQEKILEDIQKLYPERTRFVVLPMDIEPAGYKPPKKTLREQHDALHRLASHDIYGPAVIPFAGFHPKREGAVDEVTRCVEELGFKGVKIYPKLGYDPNDKVLVDHIYPLCIEHDIPVMSHCSSGGVGPAGVSSARAAEHGHPKKYHALMKEWGPKGLRICLAHFGGDDAWDAYIRRGILPGDEESRAENWLTTILDLLEDPEITGLYTDISYTLFNFRQNIPFLQVFLRSPEVRDKVLFGSDFYMTRQEDLSERAVSMMLRAALGDADFKQIAQTNPQAWLDPNGKWIDKPIAVAP